MYTQVLKSLVVPLNSLIVLICEASVCRTRGSWKRQFNLLIKIARQFIKSLQVAR